MTPLDTAHAAICDDASRLRFYDRLVATELHLLLKEEAQGDIIEPRLFPLEDMQIVLAFDTPERLTEFTGGIVPHATLSGRLLLGMIAKEGLGLGVNLETAPSATLLPPDAVQWLTQTLENAPDEVAATPEEFSAPTGLPEALITALDARLAASAGLAKMAYLVAVRYDTGAQSHLLAFVDAVPGAQPSLARNVNEALVFSGIEAGALDVAFFAASDPMAARLARVGLRFDLPQPESPPVRAAPGSDPDRPPLLK